MSASSALDDTHILSFKGPVISVSRSNAAVANAALVFVPAGSAS
jgi:hypothetical protein